MSLIRWYTKGRGEFIEGEGEMFIFVWEKEGEKRLRRIMREDMERIRRREKRKDELARALSLLRGFFHGIVYCKRGI